MTPVQLEVILACYYSREQPQVKKCPSMNDALNHWLHHKCIEQHTDGFFKCTDRGNAFIQMLLEVPLPVARWIDPRKEQE